MTHTQQTQTVETLARPLAHTTHPGGRDAIGILYYTKKKIYLTATRTLVESSAIVATGSAEYLKEEQQQQN